MIRPVLFLAAATALAVPAGAAEFTVAATGPVVELSVSETVKARPDLAEIGAGVTTDAATAVEAMRLNAARMDAVIRRIRELGVAEDDIQTSGISLNPRYDYDREAQQQVFRGYQAGNRVSVTLRDIGEVGAVLDALVAAGATDISGPSFSIEDDSAARAQAREAAMRRAREQALAYARMAGFATVRLLQVSEAIAAGAPQPMMRQVAMAEAADVSTPVQPGLVAAGVTVNVTYEMSN